MKAVSPVLYQTIKELQSLKSLQSFALAGGTNLFDSNYKVSKDKMMHSHDNILKMDNAVTWQIAKLQFRMSLRELCRFL